MSTKISVSAKTISISFGYDRTLLAAVKEIPGRRWNPDSKTWTIPTTRSDQLSAFISLSGAEVIDPQGLLSPPVAPNMTAEMVDVLGTGSAALHPHQQAFVAAVQHGARRLLLADQPGLGKTAQAIVAAAANGAERVVVVAPAVVKTMWEREVGIWWPGTPVQVLAGRTAAVIDPDTKVVVLNYEILGAQLNALTAWAPDAVVLDEAHYIKDTRSARGEASIALCSTVPAAGLIMALTGTPIPNKVIDLTGPLEALGWIGELGGFWGFAKRYAGAFKTGYGWELGGAENLAELNTKLVELGMVRRLKIEVLDLPARTVADQLVSLTGAKAKDMKSAQKELMDNLVAAVKEAHASAKLWAKRDKLPAPTLDAALVATAVRSAMSSGTGGSCIEQLTRLRKVTGLAKVETVIAQAQELLNAGEPVVIMTHHREVGDALLTAFPGAVEVRGGQSSTAKDEAIDAFQTGRAKVLVASIQAAGVGITLTAASNVILAELPWTAAAQEQAIDRVHRIGQEQPVTAWRILAAGTLDARMAGLIAHKADLADAVVDGLEGFQAADISAQTTALIDMVCEKLGISQEPAVALAA